MNKIKKLANELFNEDILQANIFPHTWLSGCSTIVYPCQIWSHEIVYQLKCDKNIFEDFIKEVLNKHSDTIKNGYFWKSDGSCPSTLTFKLKERVMNNE